MHPVHILYLTFIFFVALIGYTLVHKWLEQRSHHEEESNTTLESSYLIFRQDKKNKKKSQDEILCIQMQRHQNKVNHVIVTKLGQNCDQQGGDIEQMTIEYLGEE